MIEERLERVSALYEGINRRAKEEEEDESDNEWDEMEYESERESSEDEVEASDGDEVIVIDDGGGDAIDGLRREHHGKGVKWKRRNKRDNCSSDENSGGEKANERKDFSGTKEVKIVHAHVDEVDGLHGDEDAVTVRDGEGVAKNNQDMLSQSEQPQLPFTPSLKPPKKRVKRIG